MTAFLVDKDEPGFSVEMRMEEKMGLFTSDTSLLTLDNVKVPEGGRPRGGGEEDSRSRTRRC